MKETIEVVKCDICHEIINSDKVSDYRYGYVTNLKITGRTISADICSRCASKIASQYDRKFHNDVELYINKTMIELSRGSGSCNDNTTITTTIGHLKSIMLKVFLGDDN